MRLDVAPIPCTDLSVLLIPSSLSSYHRGGDSTNSSIWIVHLKILVDVFVLRRWSVSVFTGLILVENVIYSPLHAFNNAGDVVSSVSSRDDLLGGVSTFPYDICSLSVSVVVLSNSNLIFFIVLNELVFIIVMSRDQ